MTYVEIARAAWGEELPDWVLMLAEEADRTSQSGAARRIGRSAALVSHVLRGNYAGRLDLIEEVVRARIAPTAIDCPVLGGTDSGVCLDWRTRSRAFQPNNRLAVMMYRACRGCPRNRRAEDRDDDD